MSKYIIRNCPALSFSLGFYCNEYQKYCQDCTDCVMKQIVKKCKRSLEVSYCPIEREILDLLDIQEVE